MKALDRHTLLDKIGRELQARMGYADIKAYLRAQGVDTNKPTSGVNSKWVYTKEMLEDAPDKTILDIATELEIPHTYTVKPSGATIEATFWEPHHFRLFLSHLAAFKKQTGLLQGALRRYGIAAFVAHVDIEPTREWQDEIEAGLLSMDALAAILIPGFNESKWTDQEVGAAIGRQILIIPIIKGLNPYGFIGKFQGLRAEGKTVAQVAEEVFQILVSSPMTRTRMLTCLVDTTLQSTLEDDALFKLQACRGERSTCRLSGEAQGRCYGGHGIRWRKAAGSPEPIARLAEPAQGRRHGRGRFRLQRRRRSVLENFRCPENWTSPGRLELQNVGRLESAVPQSSLPRALPRQVG